MTRSSSSGGKAPEKTAFLVGTSFVDGSKVILIKSEDAYHEIERLRLRYTATVGPLFAENLAHVWQVLLTHAACCSRISARSQKHG